MALRRMDDNDMEQETSAIIRQSAGLSSRSEEERGHVLQEPGFLPLVGNGVAPTEKPATAAQALRVIQTRTVAEAYLAILKDRGVDILYVGAGTDTAPIVEAYARAPASGLNFPVAVVAVHENLAVGMAHGHYMVSGRPQAVMLHVSVGAANAICALMNATRARVPMFFTAGRTPLMKRGHLAAEPARFTGPRKCTTKLAWLASWSNGTMNCAMAATWSRSWIAR